VYCLLQRQAECIIFSLLNVICVIWSQLISDCLPVRYFHNEPFHCWWIICYLNWHSSLISNVLLLRILLTFSLVCGVLYPAYASFKAVKTRNMRAYVSCLIDFYHTLFCILWYTYTGWLGSGCKILLHLFVAVASSAGCCGGCRTLNMILYSIYTLLCSHPQWFNTKQSLRAVTQSQSQSWFNRRLTKRNTWTYEKYKQSRVNELRYKAKS